MSNLEINKKNDWFLILILTAIGVWLAFSVFGCAPKTYQYRVEFKDGSVEYFDLPYKVSRDAKSIEYNGETILGVEAIESIK